MPLLKSSQIAVQLYTLRNQMQSPKEIERMLLIVRDIGYEAVELAGLGEMDVRQWKKVLDGLGLKVCSMHEGPKALLQDAESVIERMNILQCHFVAYPYPQEEDLTNKVNVLDLAKRLGRVGDVFCRQGKTLLYHNHSLEFQRVEAELVLDLLYRNTGTKQLQAELDTYWVQHGGGDPAEWCRKMAGRLPVLHLKDYVITNQNQPAFAEVGQGNLRWDAILPAAVKAGCQWFVVEQDTCPGDPLESIRRSLEFLRRHFC